MWTQILGRSKWGALGGFILVVSLGLCSPGAAWASKKAAAQPAPAQPAPALSGDSEIIFNGKFFCSLKRRVELPFKGIITTLKAHSGQQVAAGETLATYRLAPESLMAIQRRLAPPQLAETETKLAEVERSMVPLSTKQRELTQLVQKKLAPAQSLAQANQELQYLGKEKAALGQRLQKDRQLVQQDRELLSSQLGVSLKSGQVPHEVSLKAPISGHVIYVNPELRDGAELPPLPVAFQVGVMNPMLLRAQAFEIEALQVRIGQAAEVTLDALPGRKFQGKVSRISWSAITTGPDQPAYYEIEISVPNPDLDLIEGLKARIVLRKSK
jgi:multidrug efflux pump subunit AcrA (membrane-fusion protein)